MGSEDDAAPMESHRPALERLTLDVGEMRAALLDGFRTRRAILRWEQKICIRTLGELPQRVFHGLARQFRLDGEEQPTLLGAMMVPEKRRVDLTDRAAQNLRERFYSTFILPAFHRAFRKLRDDTGEYVDSTDGERAGHAPQVQAYVAMRPAVDELEGYQQDALDAVLTGFDDTEGILKWGDAVYKATHGEVEPDFVSRCHRERSTRRLLLGDLPASGRGREQFAAHHLLPVFNKGVRDLAARAGEKPSDDSPPSGGVHL